MCIRDSLKTTIALVVIYFAGNFSIYGVNAWLPALMLEATGGAVTASYMLAMAQNAASVVANCTTGFVSEAMGRKRNLIFGYGLSVVACLIVSQAVSYTHLAVYKRQEIFFLIAKGRNAEYVQQKLVISMHTAKTHIANIYHKLGVHSSQEMLSLIETFREEDIKSQEQD